MQKKTLIHPKKEINQNKTESDGGVLLTEEVFLGTNMDERKAILPKNVGLFLTQKVLKGTDMDKRKS